jgi:hypothetical protein
VVNAIALGNNDARIGFVKRYELHPRRIESEAVKAEMGIKKPKNWKMLRKVQKFGFVLLVDEEADREQKT